MTEAPTNHLVVIVGARFGGLEAFGLVGAPVEITLIDRRNHHYGIWDGRANIRRKDFQALMEGMSHNRGSSTLAELANAASDLSSGMTGTIINLTGGKTVD